MASKASISRKDPPALVRSSIFILHSELVISQFTVEAKFSVKLESGFAVFNKNSSNAAG